MAPLPRQIATERLTLRSWRPEDAHVIGEVVLRSLEHIRPWMDWASLEPVSEETRRSLIAQWDTTRLSGDEAVYGIFVDNRAIGATGVHRRIGPGGYEIGYWLAPDATGHGYVTESTRALTTMVLDQPGCDHVEIHHDPANIASGAVPRRLGYRRIANRPARITAPAHTGSHDIWQVRQQQWNR